MMQLAAVKNVTGHSCVILHRLPRACVSSYILLYISLSRSQWISLVVHNAIDDHFKDKENHHDNHQGVQDWDPGVIRNIHDHKPH